MMSYRMSPSQIIKFVELYKVCECLWDRNSPEYKNRNERNKALNLISEEMKITGFGPKDVATKINNIRTTYKQELKKVRKSKVRAKYTEDVYKSKLPWFESADSFLKLIYAVPNPRGSSTSLVSYDDENKDCIRPITTVAIQQKDESSSQETVTKRRKLNHEEPRTPSYIFESTPGDRKALFKQSDNTETEFDHWTKSLAVQLNGMDVIRALKLQLQMQTLLTNERLGHETSRRDQESQSSTFGFLNSSAENHEEPSPRGDACPLILADDSDTMSSMFSLTNEDLSSTDI